MSLAQDQIIHLQKLTALIGDDTLEIETVVDSFSSLETVDISHVSETRRSGQQSLTLREDVCTIQSELPDKLLACSQQKIAAHQIVLGGIMIGE